MILTEPLKEANSCMQDSAYQAGSFPEAAKPASPTSMAQGATTPLPFACQPTITVVRPKESVDVASWHVGLRFKPSD